MKYPFLVDTELMCQHIDLQSGTQYPAQGQEVLLPTKLLKEVKKR